MTYASLGKNKVKILEKVAVLQKNRIWSFAPNNFHWPTRFCRINYGVTIFTKASFLYMTENAVGMTEGQTSTTASCVTQLHSTFTR